MKTTLRVALVAALTVSIAHAEDKCRADIEKLCAGVPKGGGRINACLRANAERVSPECKAELASVARMVKEVGEVCADDVQSICPGVKPGSGAVLQCLRDFYYSVTPGCQAVVRVAQEKVAEFRKACRDDTRKFCKGVREGEGRVFACLKSREAELSPACQAMVKGDLPPMK